MPPKKNKKKEKKKKKKPYCISVVHFDSITTETVFIISIFIHLNVCSMKKKKKKC